MATEPTYLSIRQNRLQPVSDFRPVLAVAYGEQHHHAAILALGPYAPFLKEAVSKILSRIAFERVDGDNRELRICFLVQFLTYCGNPLARLCIHHPSKVVDVALGGELLDLFSAREIPTGSCGQENCQCKRRA